MGISIVDLLAPTIGALFIHKSQNQKMKTEYYSSLPNNDKARAKNTFPSSPKKMIESASSTILTSSAKKMKNRARSFGKLLSVQACTPVKVKQQADNDICDLLKAEDEITPIIYFPDNQDVVAGRTANRSATFIDPFAFSDVGITNDKKNGDDSNSPTSVIPVRLFPEESSSTSNDIPEVAPAASSIEVDDVFEPVVTFDCPVFTLDSPQDCKDQDDTSLQLSEAIKSINIKDSIASSTVREKFREMRESRRDGSMASMETWQESFPSWKGFTRGSGWNKYKWEPKSDGVV